MYCRICGTKLASDDLFCPKCGTAKNGDVKHDVRTKTSYDASYRGDHSYKSTRKNQRKKSNILNVFRMASIVLIIVMAISATVKLGPLGSFVKDGKLIESKTLTVSYNEPEVSLVDIRVDVNPLNLTEGDKELTVKKYKEILGEDGFLGTEYDISLEGQRYLRAPLTVTLPYDESAAQGCHVTVLHYEKDFEHWVPLDAEINQQESTITTTLTTLSPVRMVYFDKDYTGSFYYIENKGRSNAMMKVSYNYWDYIKNTPMEPAVIVAQDYIRTGNTVSSTEQMLKVGDDAINAVNTYYTLFGGLADTVLATANIVAPLGGAVEQVTGTLSKSIGIGSLMIAGTQLMYDLGIKESTGPQNETAVNLYKNMATNAGTLYSYFTGFSSAAFTASFFAVAVTGYVLDTLIEEAKTIQADTVEAIFTTYYQDLSTFNEEDWYNIFVDAYWDAWQNNRESEEGMNYAIQKVVEAIDRHGDKFWTEIYKEGTDALTFAVAEAGQKNYFTPTAEHKKELTTRFKRDLFSRFNEKTMPWIQRFMEENMKNSVYTSLLKMVNPLNQYYSVQIQEIAPQDSAEPCRYQNTPIRFGTVAGIVQTEFPEEWEIKTPEDDDEWAVKQDFTILGYLMAGAPDRVLIFDSKDKTIEFGKQIREERLVIKGDEAQYETLIDLSLVDGGIAGNYEVSGTITLSDETEPLTGFDAKIEQNEESVKIIFYNQTDTVLTGTYNEETKVFNGRDLKEIPTNTFEEFLASGTTFYQLYDTTIMFDFTGNKVIGEGRLSSQGPGQNNNFLDLGTTIEFVMVKVGD